MEDKMKENTEKLGMNQKIGIMLCAMVSAVATGYVPNYIIIQITLAFPWVQLV